MQIDAGFLEHHVLYKIKYCCDIPGFKLEEKIFVGLWKGEMNDWGQLNFEDREAKNNIQLFPHEIITLRTLSNAPNHSNQGGTPGGV